MSSALLPERSARATCPRCVRPLSVCYCAHVSPIDAQTRIVVLQHPRERNMPIGTGRMVTLCLPSSELHVGLVFDDAKLDALLQDPSRPPILIYPGEGSVDIVRSPPRGPVTVVIVDGTWSQAKKLVRVNPRLRSLPRYSFLPGAPSEYRIRREPKESYVSTVEAAMYVLGALEGDAFRFRALLDPFRAMVDAQLVQKALRTSPRRLCRKRTPKVPCVVPLLLELDARRDDLVCVYGEANAWPYGSPERALYEEEIVHWIAVRVSTGEVFERFIRPRFPVADATARHAGLTRQVLEDGPSAEEVSSAWRAFARESDVVASWGTHATELFRRAGGALGKQLDLRALAREVTRAKIGTLEHYLSRIGRAVPRPLAHGRAGQRLAQALVATHALLEKAHAPG